MQSWAALGTIFCRNVPQIRALVCRRGVQRNKELFALYQGKAEGICVAGPETVPAAMKPAARPCQQVRTGADNIPLIGAIRDRVTGRRRPRYRAPPVRRKTLLASAPSRHRAIETQIKKCAAAWLSGLIPGPRGPGPLIRLSGFVPTRFSDTRQVSELTSTPHGASSPCSRSHELDDC